MGFSVLWDSFSCLGDEPKIGGGFVDNED